jgi:hypothetical protein
MTQHKSITPTIKVFGATIAASTLLISAMAFSGTTSRADAASSDARQPAVLEMQPAVLEIQYAQAKTGVDATAAVDCSMHAWPYIPAGCLNDGATPVRVIGQ